jgi:hypothetical protein
VLLHFRPDVASVPKVEFRPFMVETAYDYLATILTATHKRGFVQETFGVLGIEIILKSFVAKVSGNHDQLDERYEVDRSQLPGKPANLHNLKYLAQVLHPAVRAYLLDLSDEQELEDHQDTFKISRYTYERTAPSSSSDGAHRLAAKLICKTIYLYKMQGCSDPFIAAFDVDKLYFSVVQQYAIARAP